MEAFWCYYCFFAGCGVEHCTSPLVHQTQSCLCIRSFCHTTTPCSKEDGCVGKTQKLCCLVSLMEIPPSRTPGIGACNHMCCCEKHPQVLPEDEHEAEHEKLLEETFWCFYCYCFGSGVGGCSSPLVKDYGKFFCIQSDLETT